MVMCERYPNGPQHHELARVSIVNYNGHVLLDQYVRPTMRIVNYLTWVSGITFDKVQGKPNFADIKEKVSVNIIHKYLFFLLTRVRVMGKGKRK